MADPAPRPSKEDVAYARGVRDTGVALVDMVDICDHALAALVDMDAPETVAGGIEAARDQLIAQFERIGLVSVFPIEEPFDPMVHEAIGVEACEDADRDGLICRVHRRGWLQDGAVVRAAMVTVLQAGVVIPDPSDEPATAFEPADPPAKPASRRKEPDQPAAGGDSPTARRRRQRDRTGMDSFAFYPPEKKEP